MAGSTVLIFTPKLHVRARETISVSEEGGRVQVRFYVWVLYHDAPRAELPDLVNYNEAATGTVAWTSFGREARWAS